MTVNCGKIGTYLLDVKLSLSYCGEIVPVYFRNLMKTNEVLNKTFFYNLHSRIVRDFIVIGWLLLA